MASANRSRRKFPAFGQDIVRLLLRSRPLLGRASRLSFAGPGSPSCGAPLLDCFSSTGYTAKPLRPSPVPCRIWEPGANGLGVEHRSSERGTGAFWGAPKLLTTYADEQLQMSLNTEDFMCRLPERPSRQFHRLFPATDCLLS